LTASAAASRGQHHNDRQVHLRQHHGSQHSLPQTDPARARRRSARRDHGRGRKD